MHVATLRPASLVGHWLYPGRPSALGFSVTDHATVTLPGKNNIKRIMSNLTNLTRYSDNINVVGNPLTELCADHS